MIREHLDFFCRVLEMIHNDTLFPAISGRKFLCEKCNFVCSKKSHYADHLSTAKHKMIHNDTSFPAKSGHTCLCGKTYAYHSGLSRHRLQCPLKKVEEMVSAHNEPTDKALMMRLIEENAEMKQMMFTLIKNGTHHTHHNTKTFNLQFFLNEQCKDALNMSDFVNSIQLQLEDLEETGRLGYVDGISRAVIKRLDNITEHRRPVHCSDAKREVLYIKHNNQWSRDSDTKDGMIHLIKQVANKHMHKIPEWVEAHPDCLHPHSRQNDTYLNIVMHSMSGATEEEQRTNLHKIISNVAREVVISK
jgi:hypothetical protein